ncbi:MAG: hypothetical protein AB7Q81_07210 [Gammaproteobacteria bacterium]
MSPTSRFLLLALFLGAAAAAPAAPVATPVTVGAALAPMDISDQHGQAGKVDESVRVLMFSRDMTANKLAKKAFLDKPAGYLDQHHAMYLIDVSGMPGFVTRNFAIPKMQKYGYRIFLDREGNLTTALPSREDLVMVMKLDHLAVESVDFVSDAAALVRAVEEGAQ